MSPEAIKTMLFEDDQYIRVIYWCEEPAIVEESIVRQRFGQKDQLTETVESSFSWWEAALVILGLVVFGEWLSNLAERKLKRLW
jgi:hypothetical protein